jgi:hypothetical protein
MKTVTDVLDAFGGVTQASITLRLPLGTVSSWQTRGYVPPDHWDTVLRAAKRRKVDLTDKDLERIAKAAARHDPLGKPRLLRRITASRQLARTMHGTPA